uniref:Uncharacterized protein n=1 Tax=Oryza sativa subsp. japonica TaxID=39947 RepID=Q6K2I4_ORYSJ|nr:hypothetical protein [Oryza sativa Japonica Group]
MDHDFAPIVVLEAMALEEEARTVTLIEASTPTLPHIVPERSLATGPGVAELSIVGPEVVDTYTGAY